MENEREQIISQTWIYDLFALAFDYLSPRFNPVRHRDGGGVCADDPALQRGDIPESLLAFLREALNASEDEFCRRLYITLIDIDRFSAPGNPFLRGPAYTASLRDLSFIRRFFFLNDRLNKTAPGYVIWKTSSGSLACMRAVYAAETGALRARRGSHLWRELDALCRPAHVPQIAVDFRTLRAVSDPAIGEEEALNIAGVPVAESYEDAPFVEVGRSNGKAFVQTSIETNCLPRVRNALRRCDFDHAQIVLCPELVVGPEVRDEIVRFMREEASSIRLILAGSFGQPSTPNRSPVWNIASIIGPGGALLLEQGKRHAYEMQLYEKENKGLDSVCPKKVLAEDLDAWQGFQVVDSTGARICVLICEDFVQPGPFREIARSFLANLILVPTLAGPLNTSTFRTEAESTSAEFDSLIAVINSAGLSRREWKVGAGAGSGPAIAVIAVPAYMYSGKCVREYNCSSDPPADKDEASMVMSKIPADFV